MEARGSSDLDQECCVFSLSFPLPSSFSSHVYMYVSACIYRHIYTISYCGKSKVERLAQCTPSYAYVLISQPQPSSTHGQSCFIYIPFHSPLLVSWIILNLTQNIMSFHHKYFSMSRYISKVELTGIVDGSVCRLRGRGRNHG